VRFVELGEYLCEVRAKQYWRLEKLKSFDEFLEKRFADPRRKAYYLMTIHEHLTRVPKGQRLLSKLRHALRRTSEADRRFRLNLAGYMATAKRRASRSERDSRGRYG
jgi:hypothetical protein